MTIQLKKLQSPTPVLTDWDNAVTEPTEIPLSQIASLPSPPTAWLSAKDMAVFGSAPLREQIGIVRCKQCDRPVLRSAFAEHHGMLYRLFVYRDVRLTAGGTASCDSLRAALAKKSGKGLEGIRFTPLQRIYILTLSRPEKRQETEGGGRDRRPNPNEEEETGGGQSHQGSI